MRSVNRPRPMTLQQLLDKIMLLVGDSVDPDLPIYFGSTWRNGELGDLLHGNINGEPCLFLVERDD